MKTIRQEVQNSRTPSLLPQQQPPSETHDSILRAFDRAKSIRAKLSAQQIELFRPDEIEVWQAGDFFCYRIGSGSRRGEAIREEHFYIGRTDDLPPLIVSSSERSNGNLNIQIRDGGSGSVYMEQTFRPIGNEGWVPDVTDAQWFTPSPLNTSLNTFGYMAAAQWIGINYAMAKRVNSSSKVLATKLRQSQKKKGGEHTLNSPPFGLCDDNICGPHSTRITRFETRPSTRNQPCFTHDLKCTFSPLITRDGRLYIYLPCSTVFGWLRKLFGSEETVGIEINVLDCCKKHDIDLWCSHNRTGDALFADQDVVDCVAISILEQSIHKMPPGCLILDYILFGLLDAIGLSILYIVAKLIAEFTGYFHAECILNLDRRNDNSCLCGGNQPTVMCCDECIDLCKELGRGQNCIQCSIGCKYNKGNGPGQGRFEATYIDPFMIPYSERNKVEHLKELDSCCPASDPRSLQSLYAVRNDEGEIELRGKACNLEPHCPTCFHCKWKCEKNMSTKKYELVIDSENEHNLPCCPSTPEYDLSALRDCNNKNKGTKLWEPV
jgi:hypothetical protein